MSTMLDISIPKIVVHATLYSQSMVSLTCRPITCVTAYLSLHRSDGYCNTHPTWLRFWGSGSLVESKWCHYVMVEADSHLKLLPATILDIYKVFGHFDMLSIGIWCSSLAHLYPPYIRSSTMSLTTLILCQIILKYMIKGLSGCFLPWEGNSSSGKSLVQLILT